MKWLLLFWFVFAAHCISRADENLDRVLAHVPEKAGLVIVAPSLDKLVNGLAEFGGSIDVAALRDLTPARVLNELDVLERMDGLDSSGPFLMALTPGRPSPLLVCWVRDADSWRAAAGAQPAGPGVWRGEMFGEPAYAGFEGNLLVVGDEPEIVRSALGGGCDFAARFGPRARAWLADNQLLVAIRVPEWKSLISPALGAARTSVQISMMVSGQQDENMLRLIGWLFDRAASLLDQVETYTAAVHVGADAVCFRDALSFNPEGSAAAYLKTVVKTRRNLLRGLLDDDDIVALAAYEWELQPGTESLNTRMLAAMFGSGPLRERLGEKKFQPGYQALLDSHKDVSGSCIAIRAASAEPLLLFSGVQFSPRPEAVLKQTRVAYETVPEFISAFGGGATVDVGCGPQQIDSTNVFACRVSFVAPDEQARRAIDTLYGRTMMTYYAAQAEGLAHVTGSAERATAQLSRMLSGHGRPLAEDPRVQQACQRLSPDPQVLVLLDAAQALGLVAHLVRPGSAAIPALENPSTTLPLIACSGYLDGQTLCGEVYLPAEPVKLVVSTVRSLRQASTSAPAHKH